ncbi:hypothetical protein BIWAKO_01811 [Bosea sp. BIWAKO-01]|nr:hypothetical protein BIWAKO_01811 [Bosea sp. BIWAKO-01]
MVAGLEVWCGRAHGADLMRATRPGPLHQRRDSQQAAPKHVRSETS